MRTVSGSPRLGTIDNLLAKTVVFARAGGVRSVGEDRLFVSGACFEPDAFGDDRLEDFPTEHLLDLHSNVFGKRSPLVMHGDDDAQNLKRRARPLPAFFHGPH